MSEIPKIIHYCWFGRGQKPPLAEKCIASWRKFLPDYEIKEWNEDNYDVNSIPYTAEAYATKKYAFVSDYARFDILYRYGGVYFDTDVEIIKSIDDILSAGPYMGRELPMTINGGLGLAAEPGMAAYSAILAHYQPLRFLQKDGSFDRKTIVQHVTETLIENGLKWREGIVDFMGVKIYPPEYFNPKDMGTGRLTITANTRTIHHYSASWYTPMDRVVQWTIVHYGIRTGQLLSLLRHNPFYIIRRACRFLRQGV